MTWLRRSTQSCHHPSSCPSKRELTDRALYMEFEPRHFCKQIDIAGAGWPAGRQRPYRSPPGSRTSGSCLPTSFRISEERKVELYFQEIAQKRAAIVIRTCGGPGASMANSAAAASAWSRCAETPDRYQRMAARVVVVSPRAAPRSSRPSDTSPVRTRYRPMDRVLCCK